MKIQQINRIQTETGCRVQIVPHSIGTNERPCTLHGNPIQVQMARSKLNEIIIRGGPRENGQNQFNNDNNHIQYNNEYQISDQVNDVIVVRAAARPYIRPLRGLTYNKKAAARPYR